MNGMGKKLLNREIKIFRITKLLERGLSEGRATSCRLSEGGATVQRQCFCFCSSNSRPNIPIFNYLHITSRLFKHSTIQFFCLQNCQIQNI